MKRFTSPTQKIGELGEGIARRYMESKGWRIVEMNFTVPVGEIDIIARQGSDYVFCEVKAVRIQQGRSAWPVWQNLHDKKLKRCAKAMQFFMYQNKIAMGQGRLVGLVVYLNMHKRLARCEWIELGGEL